MTHLATLICLVTNRDTIVRALHTNTCALLDLAFKKTEKPLSQPWPPFQPKHCIALLPAFNFPRGSFYLEKGERCICVSTTPLLLFKSLNKEYVT